LVPPVDSAISRRDAAAAMQIVHLLGRETKLAQDRLGA
jgi:hypothetical protein